MEDLNQLELQLDEHGKLIAGFLMYSLLKVYLTVSLMDSAGGVIFPRYAVISVI